MRAEQWRRAKNRNPIRLHVSLLLSYRQYLLHKAFRLEQILRPFSKNDLLLTQMETDGVLAQSSFCSFDHVYNQTLIGAAIMLKTV